MAKKKKSAGAEQATAAMSPPHEKDYRAESDARTLTDAEAIRCDEKRLSAARDHLEHSVTAHRSALKRTRGRKRGIKNGRM